MSAVVFRKSDADNLELVRQIVLRRLKDDNSWNQFYTTWDSGHADRYVTFEVLHLRDRFYVLENEVLWQLMMQGVITPGINAPNPALPFFRITDYGQKVLEAERFIPHDPAGYLDAIRDVAKTSVGEVALAYLEEALRCFTTGCHIASVLLLGVAAEAVFLELCDVIRSALQSDADRRNFDKLGPFVKPRHRWVVNKLQSLPADVRRNELPDTLDTTLTALYDLIRRQRNELGHPQEEPPSVDREQALMFFHLFPTYVKDVEAFANFCKDKGV